MNICPINNHILIKPVKYDNFISQEKETYEEVGIVVEIDKSVINTYAIQIGDKVFFDSWLAAKYPTGKNNEYFWLVKFEDIRALEKNV